MAFLKILLLATGETRDVSVKTLTLKAFKKSPSSWIRNLFVTNSMFLRSEHWPEEVFGALPRSMPMHGTLQCPFCPEISTLRHILSHCPRNPTPQCPSFCVGMEDGMGYATLLAHTHSHVCKTIRSIWDLRRDKSNANHPRDIDTLWVPRSCLCSSLSPASTFLLMAL